jgi:heat shock protein HtpX
MYEVPVPTIALSQQHAPAALVAGYRPDSTTLVLSEGTVRSLSIDELEAVIAHELAHVANRDAMVMTAVSIPAMVADGLRSRLLGMLARLGPTGQTSSGTSSSGRRTRSTRVGVSAGQRGMAARLFAVLVILVTKLVLITISTVMWIASRTIVAVLSRSRETAADRAAAEVLGSPATVASALSGLDDRIEETPRQDLRESANVSAMSILPLEPPRVEPIKLRPSGEKKPVLWSVRRPIRKAQKRLFRTHPRTENRLEKLSEIERQNR